MITQQYLKELFHYDPETGVLIWIAKRPKVSVGSEAGTISKHRRTYYRKVKIDGSMYKTHRLAWLYVYGEFPANQIDHIDGDGLNNRISNLRDVNNRENHRNVRLRADNTSGTVGVGFHKATGKWQAQIGTESGNQSLGVFTDIEDAIAARQAAEVKYGFHCNHGGVRNESN